MGTLRLIDCNLIVEEPESPLSDLLNELKIANGGRFAGLPDAVAIFPDERIAFREAKVAKRDRLNRPQHAFARLARSILGDRFDLAVVEWGYSVAEL